MARLGCRGRSCQAAICLGEVHEAFEPGIAEWDFLARGNSRRSRQRVGTPGTETSQYREEEKAIAMPGVTASETGKRVNRTWLGDQLGMWGCKTSSNSSHGKSKSLEKDTEEGDSPVDVTVQDTRRSILNTVPRKWCGKLGGSTPNPKYAPRPIAQQYREGKLKSTPEGG